MKSIILILSLCLSCSGVQNNSVKTQKNLAYVESSALDEQKLDVYSPANLTGKAPVLIHIHGGGWRLGDKKMTDDHGEYFASQGIVFVTLNYRLSPKYKHPAHIEDCAAGVAWVIKNLDKLNGDKNRIYLSGHSAGAHLAALLGTGEKYLGKHGLKPDLFAGVIPVDTASYDFLSDNAERIVAGMIKTAFGTDKDVLKEASPHQQLFNDKKYPPFHVFVTKKRDKAVTNSQDFVNKINSVGGKASIIKIDGHSHRDMHMGMYKAGDPVNTELMKILK